MPHPPLLTNRKRTYYTQRARPRKSQSLGRPFSRGRTAHREGHAAPTESRSVAKVLSTSWLGENIRSEDLRSLHQDAGR